MAKIGAEKGQTERRGLKVDERMRVVGADGIFALGDCAASKYPQTAQVASQEGAWLGRLFNTISRDLGTPGMKDRSALITAVDKSAPFKYEHFGQFAYIGDYQAIAQVDRKDLITSKGWATWLLWRSVYMSKLLSIRNRFFVALDWTKALLFGRDISRG